MSVQPNAAPKRSFIYRILATAGAEFETIGDSAMALHFGAAEQEVGVAKRMGLADLSPLPRTGYKGAAAPDWLRVQGLSLPQAPNTATLQDDGVLVAALSWQEHLILEAIGGPGIRCRTLDQHWSLDSAGRCYHLPRSDSHCWFAVSGEYVSAMLAKLCAVDLRLHKFANHSVAQTMLARIGAIIIRADLGATPVFHILADSASGDYLWTCLQDAMNEFEGAAVGMAALRQLD